MATYTWAKKEVIIACERENPNRKNGEFDYGCACYESALKAFKCLCEDGRSGFSIKMTQEILNRLIDGKPLTPIDELKDVWMLECSDEDKMTYQSKRMSSLFAEVYKDGTTIYRDNNYCYCVDIRNSTNIYNFGLVSRIVHELFPISMPYMPDEPIKVYCEDYLTDKNNGDFDTVGVFYALKEEDGRQKRIEINRFFRAPFSDESCDKKYPGWVEISEGEYKERKLKKNRKGVLNETSKETNS